MNSRFDTAFKMTEAVLWRIDEALAALSGFDACFLDSFGVLIEPEARRREVRAAVIALIQALILLEGPSWPGPSDSDGL